jgi:hypothetical protein
MAFILSTGFPKLKEMFQPIPPQTSEFSSCVAVVLRLSATVYTPLV